MVQNERSLTSSNQIPSWPVVVTAYGKIKIVHVVMSKTLEKIF